MARNKNLDADVLYHCQEHTNLLMEDVNLGVLWDEYGIIGDLIVSPFIVVGNDYFIHHPYPAFC